MDKELRTLYIMFLKKEQRLLLNNFEGIIVKPDNFISSSTLIQYAKQQGMEIRIRIC